MARRKNLPEVVRAKCSLAERLREIRTDLFGERGGSEMARRLEVPVRTWYNYESGVTVPAEVLLRFMELTQVEPCWLLHGTGSRFRADSKPGESNAPLGSVESLLRSALEKLERRSEPVSVGSQAGLRPSMGETVSFTETVPRAKLRAPGQPLAKTDQAYRSWLEAQRDGRIVKAAGEAMVPIVAEGAQVAFAAEDESADSLDGALVVVWIEEQPTVRWFRKSGGFGILGVENPGHMPSIQLVDLGDPARDLRIRRVLWISTPH